MSVNVYTNRLFVVNGDLGLDEYRAALYARLIPGAVYWLVSNRKVAFGGYLGEYELTYKHRGMYSPNGQRFSNIPCRYFLSYTGE